MKIKYPVNSLFLVCFILSSIYSCKKEAIKTTPTITISTVSNISTTSAASGGVVTSDGGAALTARGVCWSTNHNPTIIGSRTSDGTGSGSFTSQITGLEQGTTYYLVAYATNSIGTAYSDLITFVTLGPSLPITDIDGNVYKTVRIGSQVWMAENLKTTKYRNGDPIPDVTDSAVWMAESTGAYCIYNNDPANKLIYGALYNGFSVTDSRNIAPDGWHVPTDTEWTTLTDYLGGASVAGDKLKEIGSTHWTGVSVAYNNNAATNSSGFTALPGGERLDGSYGLHGEFADVGYHGLWWSRSASYNGEMWMWYIYYGTSDVLHGSYSKWMGLSVRCVKD